MHILTDKDYTVLTSTQSKPLLKVAVDVHLSRYVCAIQEDGSHPKPAQGFAPADFLKWIKKKLGEGWQIVSCYEAGPFGYVLHRQLSALGVTNYVVRPRHWDEHQGRVKTDRVDARHMLNALDRFVAGNPKALALVQVPTETQERRRSQSRIRQSLRRDLAMIAQRGRGLAMQYGYRLKGVWFGARNWPKWLESLPAWLLELLTPLRQSALFLYQQMRQLTQQIEASSSVPKPKGMGSYTEQILEREVGDWTRFKNRRQVSSYFGLCPSESSSGCRQRRGAISKTGNPRVRWALTEMVWRLLRFQPEYRLVKKWQPLLLNSQTTPGRRRQIMVALARGFGVDWWRLRTHQTTAVKLGLKME
jgi:transposase